MPSLMATSLRWRTHSARTNFVLSVGDQAFVPDYNLLFARTLFDVESSIFKMLYTFRMNCVI